MSKKDLRIESANVVFTLNTHSPEMIEHMQDEAWYYSRLITVERELYLTHELELLDIIETIRRGLRDLMNYRTTLLQLEALRIVDEEVND